MAREAGAKRDGNEMKRQLQYDIKRQERGSFGLIVAAVGALILAMYMSGCDALNPAEAKLNQYKREGIVRHLEQFGGGSYRVVNMWVGFEFFILRNTEKKVVLDTIVERYHRPTSVDLFSAAGCDVKAAAWPQATHDDQKTTGCGARIGSYMGSRITKQYRWGANPLVSQPAIKKKLEKQWKAESEALHKWVEDYLKKHEAKKKAAGK